MYFTNIVSLALLAISPALALPSGEDASQLETRGQCPGNQKWCGWTKSCKCDNWHVWDQEKQKCHYPPWGQPTCPWGQKSYCCKDQQHWCEWGAEQDYCYNDGHNKAFCCDPNNLSWCEQQYCAPPSPPPCDTKHGWTWDMGSKKCVCKPGLEERNGKCKPPPMPKPVCPWGQSPYCANNKKKWCDYDENKDECCDTGKHVTFCCEPGQQAGWMNANWSD